MIAFEIEKTMMVSYQSFEILQKAIEPVEKSKPSRRRMVIISFIIGLFISITGVFLLRFFFTLRKRFNENKVS